MQTSVLKSSKNCMDIYEGIEGKFYIDAESYFKELHHVFTMAEHTIYILGWDINTQLKLIQSSNKTHFPSALGELLKTLVEKRELEVKILTWDFLPVYLLERELFSKFKIRWEYSKKIDFVYDDNHPLLASHHQKIVVVDDSVAFCGGLDLTFDRWDNPEHSPGNKKRVNANGTSYGPFHDVQVGVTGAAARGLSEIFRFRWKNATGEEIQEDSRNPKRRFLINSDFKNARVGISRTFPAFKNYPAVNEIRQLYLDAIADAKGLIYIENQYLTSDDIATAIASSLDKEKGPQIVIVLPKRNKGWVETRALSTKQAAIIKTLRNKDRFGRFHAVFPEIPGLSEDLYLTVHSKVMIVDDIYAHVGSSNLTQRSMVLDSECDLTIEGQDLRARKSIIDFESRLISEHSGLSEGVVFHLLDQGKYRELVNQIKQREIQQEQRRLRSLPDLPFEISKPAIELIDSESPAMFDHVIDQYVTNKLHPRKEFFKRSFRNILIAGLIVCLGFIAWKIYPLLDPINGDWLRQTVQDLENMEFGFLYTMLLFALLTSLFVPLNFLILVIATIQESWLAIFSIITGSMLSAAVTYWIGKTIGPKVVARRWSGAYKRIKKTLLTQKITPVVVIRMVPIAPFGVINVLCGAVQVHFGKYLIGTFLGILPGTMTLVFLQKSLLSVILEPNFRNFSIAILIGILIFTVYRFAKKRMAS